MSRTSAVRHSHTASREREQETAKRDYTKWVKRILSLLSPLYCAFVIFFAYHSVFYKLVLIDTAKACMIVTGISVLAVAVMLYTREQLLTKLCSLIMLPVMVFPVMIYFGQWAVLAPMLAVSLVIFFLSGFGETAKTVWGTIFLLIYLLGALVYFVVTSMFAPSTVTTLVQEGVSPSGLYRYEVFNTTDSSNGSTKVSVESNTMDKVYYRLFWFKIRGLSHDVVMERPLREPEDIQITWDTKSRQEITEELEAISENVEVTLTDHQMDILGRDAYQVTFSNGDVISMKQADYHQTVITLGAKEQEVLDTDKTELKLDELSDKAKTKLGITIEDFKTIKLADLTDDDLATLGIPEQGDVMYYNDKVVFRYYIAILEQYFDISKQEITIL
ncbi:MAG: hypothetical protein IJJ69_05685 [Oscillospiraceae bacterium]|nr:hypothetical protein [Oscillospiraceae bacterium]